ncbi:MAG TPA: aminotransferase class I/II-fold pyridoxal phosphate-dependent enzyme [Kofleriaceae bacterium]
MREPAVREVIAPAAGDLLRRPHINFGDEQFLMFVLDQMAHDYEQQYDDVIRLTLGKSELPVDPSITEAMVEAARAFDKSALVFPAGLPRLREKLAAYESRRHGVAIRPDNVIVSVGTSTMFRNLFALLTRAGDEVLLPLPYYPLYRFSAMLADATVRYYRIDLSSMRLDLDSFRASFSDATRVVVINSPGNPLGNVLTRDELAAIDRVVGGRAVIICDQIYDNICFDGPAPSMLSLAGARAKLILSNAFSKGYRMYARRIGYAVVPDALIEPLTVVQHHTLLTADPVPQFGALAALDRPGDVAELATRYRGRRDYTLRRFAEVPGVRALPAQGSFYMTLDCRELMVSRRFASSLAIATAIMESTHVATVPGSDFGLPGTLRLSFTSSRYEEGIDRLVSFFTA